MSLSQQTRSSNSSMGISQFILWKGEERNVTNNLFKGPCRCMSTMLRILEPSSFFCHDPWDYLYGGGLCVGVWTREATPPRRGLRYQSQKAVGRMERVDAVGVCFCSNPFHQDPLKRSPRRRIRRGSELFHLIGYGGRADVGAAAGGSDDSSSSTLTPRDGLTAPAALTQQPADTGGGGPQAHNTHPSLGWLSKTHAHYALFTSASLHQRWTYMLALKLCLLLKCNMGVHWPFMNPLQAAIDKVNIMSWGQSFTPSLQ